MLRCFPGRRKAVPGGCGKNFLFFTPRQTPEHFGSPYNVRGTRETGVLGARDAPCHKDVATELQGVRQPRLREASWVSAAPNALTECQRVPGERPSGCEGRTAADFRVRFGRRASDSPLSGAEDMLSAIVRSADGRPGTSSKLSLGARTARPAGKYWKDTRMPMRYGERIIAGRGAMARAAKQQGRDLLYKFGLEGTGNAPEDFNTDLDFRPAAG